MSSRKLLSATVQRRSVILYSLGGQKWEALVGFCPGAIRISNKNCGQIGEVYVLLAPRSTIPRER